MLIQTPEIPFENAPFYVQVIILSFIAGLVILLIFALAWNGWGEEEKDGDSSSKTK